MHLKEKKYFIGQIQQQQKLCLPVVLYARGKMSYPIQRVQGVVTLEFKVLTPSYLQCASNVFSNKINAIDRWLINWLIIYIMYNEVKT